jgi:integrase/recombinase XerD
VSRATRRRHLVALSAACRFAVRRKLLPALPIPAGEWELPRAPKPEPRTIAPADLPRLLNAAPHPRIRMALALAAFAGLRAGEIATLRWTDIAEGAVHVRAEHSKSGRARAVPLVPPLAAELAKWRKAAPPVETGVLVLGREILDLQHPVSKAFRAADLYDPTIRPGLHCLRRFAATTLARALSPADLRDAMGWASIALAAHYCEAARSKQRLAAQAAKAFAEAGF